MARQWHHADWADEQFDEDEPSIIAVTPYERPLPHHSPQLGFWPAERGSVCWEGVVDLQGSFPGFTAWGGFAEGVQLQLTDRYLLIEDGTAHGFGLPLGWISTSMTMAGAGGATLGHDGRFRVRYMDGSHMRGFALKVRGGRFGFGVQRRMQQFADALYEAELFHQDDEDGFLFPPEIDLSVSWDDAEQYEKERVIWRGRAIAPVGWALDHAPSDVWLTTESIIWGTGTGSGIYRLPVTDIVEATPADLPGRSPIPGLFVTVYVGEIGRVDLPFMFDCGTSIPRNVQDRGAFLVALRSRGIDLGIPEHPPQPWLPAPPELPEVSVEAPVMTPKPNTAIQPKYGRLAAILPQDAAQSDQEPDATEPSESESAPPAAEKIDLLQQPAAALLGLDREKDLRSIWPPAVPSMRSRLALTVDGSQSSRGVVVPFPSAASSASNQQSAVAVSAAAASPERAEVPTPAAIGTLSAEPSPSPAALSQTETEADTEANRQSSAPVVKPSIAALVQADTPETAETVEDAVRAAPPDLARLEAYEQAVARSLAAVQATIEARLNGDAAATSEAAVTVPAGEKAEALAALDRAVASGMISEDAASSRRQEIEGASEAAIRLHSFLHFLDCGYFDLDTLREKRDDIANELLRRDHVAS